MSVNVSPNNTVRLQIPMHGEFSTTRGNLDHQIATTTPEDRRRYFVDLHCDDPDLIASYEAMSQCLIDVMYADCNRHPDHDTYDRG